jgi:hypothetical protein
MPFKERYFNIWKSGWDLHRKFDGTSVNDDDRWSSLLDEARALKQKYEKTSEADFAKDLVLAVCAEIERSSKNAKKKQEPKATGNAQA